MSLICNRIDGSRTVCILILVVFVRKLHILVIEAFIHMKARFFFAFSAGNNLTHADKKCKAFEADKQMPQVN